LLWTSNRGKSWTDISPAPIQVAYFLPSGHVWAFTTLNVETPELYYSSNWGVSWESYQLTLPPDDWRAVQLQFSSDSSGWLVLQKVTSQAFDTGVLLKTIDGGLTWQTINLPTAGQITFTTPTDGWLLNAERELLFHTSDGGLAWQAARLTDYPSVRATLPAATILSGWQTNGLGWAATSNGSCQGEKTKPGFTCQVDNSLWQSVDGGKTWKLVALPTEATIKP